MAGGLHDGVASKDESAVDKKFSGEGGAEGEVVEDGVEETE